MTSYFQSDLSAIKMCLSGIRNSKQNVSIFISYEAFIRGSKISAASGFDTYIRNN